MARILINEIPIAPTPWRVGPVDDTVVTAADGTEIAAIDGDYNDPDTWPTMEAHARLIAAAPDLYAALKFAETLMGHPNQMIDDALAKAEGRAP